MAEPVLLKFLTPEELDAIHTATLRILSEIGVVLTHPGAREILTGSGAVVEGTHLRDILCPVSGPFFHQVDPELLWRRCAVDKRARHRRCRAIGDSGASASATRFRNADI